MSVRIMGGVWDLDLDPPKKFVLLAMADHADHDGRKCHPSVRLVAHKTGYSERQVQYIVRELETLGILEVEQPGGGRGNPTHYRIVLENGAKTAPFMPEKGADIAPITAQKGAIQAEERVQSTTERVQSTTERVQSSRAHVDKVNRQEPSREERTAPAEPKPLQPWGLLEAVCEEMGADATGLPGSVRARQLAVAKRLIADGFTEDDGRRMVRWLLPQGWVNGSVDLFLIEKQRGKWLMARKPDAPPPPVPRAPSPNGTAPPPTVERGNVPSDGGLAAFRASGRRS